MDTPIIVTIANQKGGVGKTTLCIAFANYLVQMGARVLVVDLDFQQSVVKCRQADIIKYGEGAILYDIISARPSNDQEMSSLLRRFRNDPSIDVVIIDSAGSLLTPGLISLFINTDIMLTPFQYDGVASPSTFAFLLFVSRLKERMKDKMNTQIFLIPNRINPKVGKKSELKAWEVTKDKYSKYGVVTERIPVRSEMTRLSTIAALDRHKEIVSSVFLNIYSLMFGSIDPIRPMNLEGIQLFKNIKRMEKTLSSEQNISEE